MTDKPSKRRAFALAAAALASCTACAETCDWASKPLAIAPELFERTFAGRRDVEWFRHGTDPAWGAAENFTDRFAVAKPVGGDRSGAPLLVVLHWRGGGFPSGGIEMQVPLSDEKDRVFSAPDGFYVLVPDDMRNYNVLLCRSHEEYWWGATPEYKGPVREDVPRLSKGPTSCERRVMDTVEWVVRRYGIDRNRIYLCGNSMGGQAAYAIGLAHGEVFAAIDANVPATAWYAAARLGFVDKDGNDAAQDPSRAFPDPPVAVEWSGVDDVWSRDRDVIYRGLVSRQWPHMFLWGDFGHCGFVSEARERNDLVERFDWLSIRRDEAYPVFTGASCDDKLPWPFKTWEPSTAWFMGWSGDVKSANMEIADGAPECGQINAFFRWRNVRDSEGVLEMDLWVASAEELGTRQFAPPGKATAFVSLRRIQTPELAGTEEVSWSYAGASGTAVRDITGALSIGRLELARTPRRLKIFTFK